MEKFITRIAPSPTGDLHFGNARTAYFNWLVSRITGGYFYVRIDDTDIERNKEDKIQDIFDILDWLGLDYDNQFKFRQSMRYDIYKNMACHLLDNGKAREENGAVYLNLPENMPSVWEDWIAGEIPITDFDIEGIKRLVILRSDGRATYQFATSIDDAEMGINFVLRGKDHISNTAKQIAILTALDMPIPNYCHVGLIFNGRKKMSKRDAESSMKSYIEKGYDPDAVLAYMLRLGWAPHKDNKENSLLLKEDALRMFLNEGKMRNSEAKFNIENLNAIHRKVRGKKGFVVPKDMSDMHGHLFEKGAKSLMI